MIVPPDFEPNIADEIEELIQDTSSTSVIESSKEVAKAAKTIKELSEILKHIAEKGCGGC
jgi:methyl-accepting chemotaxis protein